VDTDVFSNMLQNVIAGNSIGCIEPLEEMASSVSKFVAIDNIGAGIGELVLITTDETTQHALDRAAPVDAYIVGIVDSPPQIGR